MSVQERVDYLTDAVETVQEWLGDLADTVLKAQERINDLTDVVLKLIEWVEALDLEVSGDVTSRVLLVNRVLFEEGKK